MTRAELKTAVKSLIETEQFRYDSNTKQAGRFWIQETWGNRQILCYDTFECNRFSAMALKAFNTEYASREVEMCICNMIIVG